MVVGCVRPSLQPEWVQVYDPLQGEKYTYSCVLGQVQLLIRLHFHRVVNPSILHPSSPLPPVESDEVQGEGVPVPP